MAAAGLLRRAAAQIGGVSPAVAVPLSRRALDLTRRGDPERGQAIDLLVQAGRALRRRSWWPPPRATWPTRRPKRGRGSASVLLRSWGVVGNFRDTMLRALADAVPLTAWQLDDGKTPAADPDAGIGQRPGGPLPLAPDVAFHSPMLTKTARGEQNVEDIHKLIGGIQGPRTYLARITTDQKITEYWNCVIQGHLQQGIDVFDLDVAGRVVNQTVWLRPWPSVTILRDAAIAGQIPSLPADFWLLPAAPSKLS